MKYFEVDITQDFGLECICTECGTELKVEDIEAQFELIRAKIKPCPNCSQSAQIETGSEFFKDLLEYAEKELGKDAVRKLELFGMTWHKRAKEPK